MGTQYAAKFERFREVTSRRKWSAAIIAMAVTLYAGSFVYRMFAESPIVYDHTGDRIEPAVIRAGEEFRVLRSFHATRDAHIFISRVVIKGDCRRTCEILDISQGYSYIEKGEYVRWREHKMPNRASPGQWTFMVTAQWQDRLGFTHDIKLKPLTIEVVQ